MREYFFSKTKLATEVRPGMTTPCLEWQASRNRKGYGQVRYDGKNDGAHRVAWVLEHGPIPDGLYILHRCDNPPCVAVEHLFLGTAADNMADKMAKGRHVALSGDAHPARLHPERQPRGDAHHSRLHPERLARGNAHGARLHPESRPRGERVRTAKLTEDNVRFILQLRAQGWKQKRLAAEFGVNRSLISYVLARKIWAHVDLEVRP